MSGNELQIAKERLQLYREAEKKILSGAQSYSIAGRSLTRANLGEVQKMISQLEADIRALETRGTTRRPVYRVCPLDD